VRIFTRPLGIAAAAIALVVASGCSGSEADDSDSGAQPGATTKVSYVTGLNIQGREAYVYVAQEKGYFKEAGLEVDVKPGVGTEANLKLLQSGQADFAVLDITAALIDYGKGAFKDFTIINALQQSNLACLMALEGEGITTPKDLEGKKIAYIPGGVVRVLFETYAKLAGVNASTVTWVNMPAQQIPAGLAAGSIDVATQFVVGKPQIEAVAKGKKAVVFPYSNYLTDLYGNGVGVTKKTAQEKPDLVKKFNDALLKGLAYAIDHPDEAGQIYAKYQKLQPPPVAAAEVTLLKPYVQVGGAPIGALNRERVARNIAILQGAGTIPGAVNADDLFSFDLAPKS
jgi:NitT/TauT family transport system substrate-binding protein